MGITMQGFIVKFVVLIMMVMVAFNADAILVQVEGVALITDQGVAKARQQAIQDAIRQAALQAGARVSTSSELSSGVLTFDNVRVRATGIVRDVVVLDEWISEEDDLLYVLIRAKVTDTDPATEDEIAKRYRRKIAVTQFNVKDRRQIYDLPGIEVEMPKEFARRLQLEENFLTVDATRYVLPDSAESYSALGKSASEVVVNLAEQLGVQFIISGTLRDLGVTKHPLFVRLRHVEVELKVLDGISGAVVAQHRVNGSVWQGRPFDFPTTTPAMADKFFASPIGQTTNKVMIELVKQVARSIRRLPFTARVLQAQGKKVHFDVGAMAQVKVGDVFMAYKIANDPIFNSSGQRFLGHQETPAMTLVVRQVQPMFAIGELETDATRLYSGDIVRFVW